LKKIAGSVRHSGVLIFAKNKKRWSKRAEKTRLQKVPEKLLGRQFPYF
jgi:hypothetical protein